MSTLKRPAYLALLVTLMSVVPQAATAATVIFEFFGACTALRNIDCAAFGLDFDDAVTGGFQVDASLGQPGAVSLLTSDQYLFAFTFGNQHFAQDDALGLFAFNVSGDGASISSIAGSFRNAAGAVLSTITITTTNVALGEFEADTFTFGTAAIGRGWKLSENSDLFVAPVPLPASVWMMAGALLSFARMRARAGRVEFSGAKMSEVAWSSPHYD
ncbi:MAG: hypothetical protein H6978_12200 [Gammaproteobacteria bacterium]|nr:hypothetical protein [Gammaproteobacteria bacterium]